MSWRDLAELVVAPPAGASRGRRRRRRPRGRHAAEPARDGRGDARPRLARRHLVVLLARFRRARRGWTASARSSRRSSSSSDGYWYAGKRIEVEPKLGPIVAQCRPCSRSSSSPISRRRIRSPSGCRRRRASISSSSPITISRSIMCGSASPSRSTSCSRPARRAWPEVHRPLRRRGAAPASQGAHPAERRALRGPHFLLHHLRLDDVELARRRPRGGGDAAPLRRLAVPPPSEVLFDYAGRRAHDAVRHLGEIYRRLPEGGAHAGDHPRPLDAAPDGSTGSPLAPESFDYVYRDIARDIQLASISGGTDICSASCSACRRCRSGAARSSARASAWRSRCGTKKGRPVRQEKRASSSA